MERITYEKLKEIFEKHEEQIPKDHLTGAIVFSEDSWEKQYSLDSRTYIVSSDNKAFQPGKGGYSIFGYSKDGTDLGVRLESYMREERGGKNGWKVDYCYLIKDKKSA